MLKTAKGCPLNLTSILLQKKLKKLEGDRLESFEKVSKKNEKFQQSHSAEKSERYPLRFSSIRSVAKYQTN